MHLEYGRTHVIPQFDVRENAQCAVSFFPDPGYDLPTIEVREVGVAGESHETGWARVVGPFATKSSRLDLRISAARDRIFLGEMFSAEMRETWVATAPPEEQSVLWTFIAPSGSEHAVEAAYEGDFRWRVSFVPDEIGPWRYHWMHRFVPDGLKSPVGRFDVVAGSLEAVTDRLSMLATAVDSAARGDDPAVIEELRERFYRGRASQSLEAPSPLHCRRGRSLASRA